MMEMLEPPSIGVYATVARSIFPDGQGHCWFNPMVDIVLCLYYGQADAAAFDFVLDVLDDIQLGWAEQMLDDYRENGVTDGLRAIGQRLEAEGWRWDPQRNGLRYRPGTGG